MNLGPLSSRDQVLWDSEPVGKERVDLLRDLHVGEVALAGEGVKAARKSPRTRHHRRFANNLLKLWPALWTFVTVEGVEPTNNAAERALRGPVIYRRLSHGTQSDDGERFIERALSVSVTCRLQCRSMFTYMRELLTAHVRGDPLPTLA